MLQQYKYNTNVNIYIPVVARVDVKLLSSSETIVGFRKSGAVSYTDI
jgi:hypothetical protein